MLKDKIDLSRRSLVTRALKKLRGAAAARSDRPRLNRVDGLKISFTDRWLHVRPSGTEPIMRIFAEAPTLPAARKLIAWAKAAMR